MLQRKKWCLSEREGDVLLMTALGYGNGLIADYLKLSVQAVECHRADLCKKLGIVDSGNLDAVIAAALFKSARPGSEPTDGDRLEKPEVLDRFSSVTFPQLNAIHDP